MQLSAYHYAKLHHAQNEQRLRARRSIKRCVPAREENPIKANLCVRSTDARVDPLTHRLYVFSISSRPRSEGRGALVRSDVNGMGLDLSYSCQRCGVVLELTGPSVQFRGKDR